MTHKIALYFSGMTVLYGHEYLFWQSCNCLLMTLTLGLLGFSLTACPIRDRCFRHVALHALTIDHTELSIWYAWVPMNILIEDKLSALCWWGSGLKLLYAILRSRQVFFNMVKEGGGPLYESVSCAIWEYWMYYLKNIQFFYIKGYWTNSLIILWLLRVA